MARVTVFPSSNIDAIDGMDHNKNGDNLIEFPLSG